jgi:flagellar biogenesis protein FliO
MKKKTLLFALLGIPFFLFATPEAPSSSDKNTTIEESLNISDVKPEAPPQKPGGDPYHIESDGYKTQFIKTLAAILVVLILVALAVLLFRRLSGTRPLQMNSRKHIKVIERRPLSPNTYLYYIEVGNKQFVIAESKLDVKTVANLDWTETEQDS